ncbi:MAG TPA: LacI family DNA-binding transcriptional regulator [Actinomycetes bacterium]|nr:LacI family DNA-binding transcriptional regulator [Actinomycetes bacterium]
MTSAVTLKDVARLAGVHAGTASKALNPLTRKGVSSRTVQAVLEAASQLGYRPDPIARSLRTNRSNVVGIILPDLTNPMFPPAVRGIEDALREAGYTALVANTDQDLVREEEIYRAMRGRRVDGFIIATARREHPLLREAADEGVAIVQLNRVTDDGRIPGVLVDDTAGVSRAVDHLVSLGHRHLAHLAGPADLSTAESRMQAFLGACHRHGKAVARPVIDNCESYSVDAGAAATEALLAKHPECTAIVAGNDLIALGSYRALAKAGLSIPGDISVVGFNDMPFVDMLQPPMTTVHVPHYHLGVEAARLLLERLRDERTPAKRLLLPSDLVVRGSTGAPPQERAPRRTPRRRAASQAS